ncbi:MAG: UDP-N-acetylmuramoyl-L-alanyl-D-glutamate--2,6-diaminopimelate ligase [Proteobacteria bacterium]|nr:UDP-N-acetylmuramoyl-L-alanyl-D-glutamate--2,6-diaminopimelate ligase [Pseudomonadota bacterium]
MKLSQLTKNLTVLSPLPLTRGNGRTGKISFKTDPEILSVHSRAQDVQKGGLFVAVEGFSADGHDFIEEAQKNGAVAVITQKPVQTDILTICVENTRKALSEISAEFYGHPSKDLVVIGVTGTNGKTTTVSMIEAMLLCAGYQTGVIGTIDYHYLGKAFPNPNTTPESLNLQRILSEMRAQDVTHVIMEVSSHAISLSRVDHCFFDICIFTNLSQDHLDFHKDMESYFFCKKRLFTDFLVNGPKKNRAKAVINIKDLYGKTLPPDIKVPVISTGNTEGSNIRSDEIVFGISGISGKIITEDGSFNFQSKAVGSHNLENIMNAAGTGMALGLSSDIIQSGISAFTSVPGRLETVASLSGRSVFVDYAHTPDALEKVLTVLKPLVNKRLITVFGCGGDRDKKKRPMMGEISTELSDLSIITSDNPRTEEPKDIIEDILSGITPKKCLRYFTETISSTFIEKGYLVEPDRKTAIRLAVNISTTGDTVIIAGKGHETYQIIGKKTYPFDDRIEALHALEENDRKQNDHTMGN